MLTDMGAFRRPPMEGRGAGLAKLCKRKGHGLALCRINPNVCQPVTTMKLERLLKLFDDLSGAVASLSGH